MWQHVKLSEQTRPWDTLACCWDVKQPTNKHHNIIIIALKGAIRRELSPTLMLKWPRRHRAQITCNVSSAYQVQHAVCHLVRRENSSIKFDGLKFVFAYFIGWNHLLTKEGFVCRLLNVPARCQCISGTDLLRQVYVLPHWHRSCRSNFLSHPVTLYWHQASQSQRWPYIARHLAG